MANNEEVVKLRAEVARLEGWRDEFCTEAKSLEAERDAALKALRELVEALVAEEEAWQETLVEPVEAAAVEGQHGLFSDTIESALAAATALLEATR